MDSNGRHRAPSGSNLTLPNSSTFRRLPTLARSPFKRSDKPSPQQTLDSSIDPTDAAGASESKRAAPFPPLGSVISDEKATLHLPPTSSSSADDQSNHLSLGASFQLFPPSRTSSLPQTPNIPDNNDNPMSFNPPDSGPSFSSMLQAGSSMAASTSAIHSQQMPIDSSDLQPITYPAHLAQATAPPESLAATHPTPRSRDIGLAMGSSIVLGHIAGPPATKLDRKSSVTGSASENRRPLPGDESAQDGNSSRQDLDAGQTMPRTSRERDGETDSGADETIIRRRRAGTRTTIDRNAIATSSNHRERDSNSDRDRTHKSSLRTMRDTPLTRRLDPTLPSSRGAVRVPASAMYFSLVPCHGRPPSQALRAHSGTLVGDRIWLIGGVDKQSCWRGVSWFDTESLQWTTIETQGQQFPPLRAHSTTLVGHKLFIFGGGDGPSYSNDVWILDTLTHCFTKPTIGSPRSALPPPRRAHTTVQYRNYLVVFGGGNGQAALNDVWALDVSDLEHLTWHEWKTKGDIPQKKGYHSANLVGDKMIVFGGSDGHASFADVHILNLKTLVWTLVVTDVKHNRLSHTSTQVGSYLFIIGGHNGQTYAQDVLLFNLVTLQWETKVPRGTAPPGRGYHVALLHDARIFISGGYNGESVFDDLWSLDLSAGAYLPQVTTFEVDEGAEQSKRQQVEATDYSI